MLFRLLNKRLVAILSFFLISFAVRSLAIAHVTLGDDVFLRDTWRELHGRCIGILTNRAGVTGTGVPIVDAIEQNAHICIRAIYAPEHGFRADRGAGADVESSIDRKTRLPIYALTGANKTVPARLFHNVDVVVVDLQDVGDRAYTYIWTLAYAMKTAAASHREIWVLDRPNPLGGDVVEGPVLEPRFASFIGLYPIALRHGMTIGELARLFNTEFSIGCSLKVISMQGYEREMMWPDTGLTWVPTSPNIPTWRSTVLYPATGLLAAAGFDNGANTQRPFALVGSPRLDALLLAKKLERQRIPGVRFRPATWRSRAGIWSGKMVRGIELTVTDPRAFRAVSTAVVILTTIRSMRSAYLRELEPELLDFDWGTNTLRLHLQSGASAETIVARWAAGVDVFRYRRDPYLLYR